MKKRSGRQYHSPLRRSGAEEPRRRILEAVGQALEGDPDHALSLSEVARAAGIRERAVYRHFPGKEALLDAFWVWVNARVGFWRHPTSERELLEQPPAVFAGFDRDEGLIRASLCTRAGRDSCSRPCSASTAPPPGRA